MIGIDTIRRVFSGKGLIGLLNWSELAHSTEVWEGLLNEVLPSKPGGVRTLGLFDLSDCSEKTQAELLKAIRLLRRFSAHWEVVLSLNMNESHLIYKALTNDSGQLPGITDMASALYDAAGLPKIVVHHFSEACCCDGNGVTYSASRKLDSRRLLTGAGDNLNTGFCAGTVILVIAHRDRNGFPVQQVAI